MVSCLSRARGVASILTLKQMRILSFKKNSIICVGQIIETSISYY